MGPTTLAARLESGQLGISSDAALALFVVLSISPPTAEERYLMMAEQPELTNGKRLDALGAMAEYLAKQHKLGRVAPGASGPARFLDHPWHTCPLRANLSL